jgi:pimeloyl-ACP methyl ester carboxylesterase
MTELSTARVSANGLEFAYLEVGEGALALCLHGFPDSAWTWHRLLPALAQRGYRAVAPWLRGYAPTEVPRDGRYEGAALVSDATALHEALAGDEDAVIIGHDWGAYAAYGAAAYSPERWRRVVTIAVPPLALASRGILNYEQLQRSWYQFFFQHPLAEAVVARDDFRFIDRLWSEWSPGFAAGQSLLHAKRALQGEGNLAAALGYYRAMWHPDSQDADRAPMQEALLQPTPQPTLYLHGDSDGCFPADAAAGAEEHLGPGSRREIVRDAGHFPHLEQPSDVIPRIVEFVDSRVRAQS